MFLSGQGLHGTYLLYGDKHYCYHYHNLFDTAKACNAAVMGMVRHELVTTHGN